jgi:hypothetical protein
MEYTICGAIQLSCGTTITKYLCRDHPLRYKVYTYVSRLLSDSVGANHNESLARQPSFLTRDFSRSHDGGRAGASGDCVGAEL